MRGMGGISLSGQLLSSRPAPGKRAVGRICCPVWRYVTGSEKNTPYGAKNQN